MADLPTGFWAGWIAVITIVSLIGLGWMVFSIYFSPEEGHEEAEGPVWDSNLREGSNPAPMWWFWLILAMMVVSVLYLMLYPGLGSFQGALKWSQGGRLDESIAQYEAEFGGIRKQVCLACVPEVEVGNYVLAHVGFAIGIIDEEEAQEVFKLLEEMGELAEFELPQPR